MNIRSRNRSLPRGLNVAFLALMLAGCAGTTRAVADGEAGLGTGAVTYGKGRYPHRFILFNPQTNLPWPNRPFRLFAKHHKLPSRQPSSAVFHGVTDANGMTPIFRMKTKIWDRGWDLTERVGEGPFGRSFSLKSAGRNSKPLAGYPYALVICAQPPVVHFGVSDVRGNTAYLASGEASEVVLLTDGEVSDTDGAVREAC